MTPAEQLAADARQAIQAALAQLGAAVAEPFARLDEEARAGYFELHTVTARIVQRLSSELTPGVQQLNQQQQAIQGNVGLYEQQRLNDLAAPLQAVQQRLGGELLASIKSVGRQAS